MNTHCCKIPTVEVRSIVEGAGTTTLITGPFEGTLGCSGRFNLCIPKNFSNVFAGNLITIDDGVAIYPCETCNGNNLRAWQLITTRRCGCRQRLLHCRLLNDPVHVQILDCLPQGCNNSVAPLSTHGLPSNIINETEKVGRKNVNP